MSVVYTEITLENPVDAGMAQRGIIKETEVRKVTVNAMVDTGAWTLVMNEDIRSKLGLRIEGKRETEIAGGAKETCGITGGVTIRWKDRFITMNAAILPGENDVLLGAFPLEGLDLIVHPRLEQVVGAHGDQPLHKIK
ncbi:MAG: aspartyl protease family protein [Treponema sp.]|jgi:clan AA aspartic protease|nr:aspartyl protease family protein [Treponema sp.]